jgi:hypothetical protein
LEDSGIPAVVINVHVPLAMGTPEPGAGAVLESEDPDNRNNA